MSDAPDGDLDCSDERAADLQREVSDFASRCCMRIESTLAGQPTGGPVSIIKSPKGPRFSFRYMHPLKSERNPAVIGYFEVLFTVGRDRIGRYMAVYESSFKLLDARKRPMLRMEYIREPLNVPSSHIHIHAQSGSLTLLLAKVGHKTPASIESLHIPTGGERFRPCVEDFLEFLIVECGVQGSETWKDEVTEGRAEWREYQARSVIRDRPETAVEVLRELGAKVEFPPAGFKESPRNAF